MYHAPRKNASQTTDEIKSHRDHTITVDTGYGDGRAVFMYGFWCQTCKTPIGKYAIKKAD